MKVDLTIVLKNLKGEPLKNGDDAFTLGEAVCGALIAVLQDEQNLSHKEKNKRFKLAIKASAGGEVDFSVDETAEIIKLIGKAFPTIVVGRALEILDPSGE